MGIRSLFVDRNRDMHLCKHESLINTKDCLTSAVINSHAIKRLLVQSAKSSLSYIVLINKHIIVVFRKSMKSLTYKIWNGLKKRLFCLNLTKKAWKDQSKC
ncbi:hypothetical protein DPMN_025239 [Dreissena polymorpha]|uniref:Uncharacterized protein n=1 Tax=Dreissena polymorpha TaxID=45954 RepID=A0A9D4RCE0_DREPO|nr:hypothetical protein DPMN_025239 [Dreissena polymorpha]